MGRRNAAREQDVLIVTEADGNVEPCRLETDVLYVASPETIEAWELDYNQQAKHEKTGRHLQVVSERSKKPLKIFPDRSTLQGQSTEAIASQKQDAELTFMQSKNKRSSMLLWVGIICAILAVTIGVIVLLKMKGM